MSTDQTEKTAEHLRMIHFTIVATSLGFLFTSMLNPLAKARRALEDIETIVSLTDSWDESFLERYIDNELDINDDFQRMSPSLRNSFLIEINPEPLDAALSLYLCYDIDAIPRTTDGFRNKGAPKTSSDWTFFGRNIIAGSEDSVSPGSKPISDIDAFGLWEGTYHLEYSADGGKITDHSVTKPGSLANFQQLWDVLGEMNVYAFYQIYDKAQDRDESRHKEWITGLSITPQEQARVCTAGDASIPSANILSVSGPFFRLPPTAEESLQGWPTSAVHVLHASNSAGRHLDVPVLSREFRVDLRRALSRQAGATWDSTEFSATFPELEAATKHLRTVDIRRLRRHLQSEADKSRPHFQVLGISIPSAEFSRWGALLLIATQIYFLLHLRNSKLLFTAGSSVPWIGLYEDLWSKLALVGTITALPVAVCIRLSLPGTDSASWIWFAFLSLLSALFAGFTVVELKRLRKDKLNILRTEPGQAVETEPVDCSVTQGKAEDLR